MAPDLFEISPGGAETVVHDPIEITLGNALSGIHDSLEIFH